MKNKNGEFKDNILGAIIAVVILGGIIYLSIGLYGVTVGQEEKNAQEFLDSLVGKIENLEDGESGTFAMKWVENYRVLGYDKSLPRGEVPDKCFFESCVCICKEKGNILGSWQNEQKNECQKNGFCRELEDAEINVLIKNVFVYFGNYCKWKGSGEIVFHSGREVLHHKGTDEGELVGIEISKDNNIFTIAKIAQKDIVENSILASAVAVAGNIEKNEETKECYFVRN